MRVTTVGRFAGAAKLAALGDSPTATAVSTAITNANANAATAR